MQGCSDSMSDRVSERTVGSLENFPPMAQLEGKQQKKLIREKLRSRPPSRSGSGEISQNKGPMLARPMSPARSLYSDKSGSEGSPSPTKPTNTPTRSRSPNPKAPAGGKISPNQKTPSRGSSPAGSPKLGRPPSPRMGRSTSPLTRGRGNSPQRQQSFLELAEHVLKKRVQRALHARLYLLQKMGPYSFLVGGDSLEHKYKVKIGEQYKTLEQGTTRIGLISACKVTPAFMVKSFLELCLNCDLNCSCSRGPFCIHLFFVMLRVFKVEENDPILWSRTLKDYEVENLFNNYEKRRERNLKQARINLEKESSKGPAKERNKEGFIRFKKEYIESDEEEDHICPICLLTMVEGESMVTCQYGCFNSLHQHCMAIWAKECEYQKEPLICPLCRTTWETETLQKGGKKTKQRKFVQKIRRRKSSQSDEDPTADTTATPVLGRVLRDVNDPELAQLTIDRKKEDDRGTGKKGSKGKKNEKKLTGKNFLPKKGDALKMCDGVDDSDGEEAEALAFAMDLSWVQQPLPFIPGLMPTERDEETIVCVQVEDRDSKKGCEFDDSREYLENYQWVKGAHLGTGAFSTCYQAWDRTTGTIMAVKQISFMRNSVLDQEKVAASITKEIELMATLDHPNVIRLLGATRQGCHFNMFLEWMPAGSVSNVLECYGAFEEPLILKYTKQVLSGMVYLHQRGVIHRDLKGANLLLDSTGHLIRIADLGTAAKMTSQFTGTEEFKGQVLGTIAFMAPEVLRGETYGRSCDVWSLGCCLFEMATGEPPWDACKVSNSLQLIYRIASAKSPPTLPDHLSAELKDLILSCLQSDPSARPKSTDLKLHSVFKEE